MPSQQAYRHGFMDRVPFVGDRFITGAQSTSPDGSYVGKADGADAKRIVASTDLADDGRQTSIQDTAGDFYNGGYLWNPSTSEQRRVTDGGYTDSVDADTILDAGTTSQVGYFKVNRDYGVVIPAGTDMEFHPILPVMNADRLPGIHTLINRALSSMRWVRRITLTGNAGDRYSLAAYPEITQDAQIAQVYMDEVAANNEPSTLFDGASLRWDGSTGYLITGQYQSSSTTFTADIYIPASAWIKVGGSWAASTVGLVYETDEAMPPVNQVVSVARYFAFDALAEYALNDIETAKWERRRDRAAIIARPLMQFQQPEVSTRTRTVLRTATGGSYGSRSWP